jgi:hypothetical protein
MQPMNQNVLVPVMGIAILNGIFSPAVLFVFVTYWLWYPFFLPHIPQAVYLASSLILSTLTIMAAGVPAALYERFARNPNPTVASAIWIGFTALLTLPAIPNILRVLSAT